MNISKQEVLNKIPEYPSTTMYIIKNMFGYYNERHQSSGFNDLENVLNELYKDGLIDCKNGNGWCKK